MHVHLEKLLIMFVWSLSGVILDVKWHAKWQQDLITNVLCGAGITSTLDLATKASRQTCGESTGSGLP